MLVMQLGHHKNLSYHCSTGTETLRSCSGKSCNQTPGVLTSIYAYGHSPYTLPSLVLESFLLTGLAWSIITLKKYNPRACKAYVLKGAFTRHSTPLGKDKTAYFVIECYLKKMYWFQTCLFYW